jgi:hypothetical protein
LPFNQEVFREKFLLDIEPEFSELKKFIRDPKETVDYFVKIINAETIPSVDGANEILLDSFNRLFCSSTMKKVDKRRHFNTIVTKFEVFIKKLYYLLNNKELQGSKNNTMATFMDCIFALKCLRG